MHSLQWRSINPDFEKSIWNFQFEVSSLARQLWFKVFKAATPRRYRGNIKVHQTAIL